MCYKTSLWSKITNSTRLVTESFHKYGHNLIWKSYKECVLEVGCADGTVMKNVLHPYVRNYAHKLTGVDIDGGLIEMAKNKNQIDNVEYRVMDVMNKEKVEKMKNHFDHIFSLHVPHWIPDHRTFISGLHEMLKPGGQIFVTHVVTSPLHKSFHRHFKEGTWSKYLPQKRIILYYTEDPTGYIRKIVEEVGFKVEVCKHEIKKDPVEDFTDFLRALISLNPYLDRIPPELREDYFQDHLKYCIENSTYLGKSNVYDMAYELLTCIASKQK